jgi:hypothetical protein
VNTDLCEYLMEQTCTNGACATRSMSHVTMSVVKLLSRISSDDDANGEISVAARSLRHLGTMGSHPTLSRASAVSSLLLFMMLTIRAFPTRSWLLKTADSASCTRETVWQSTTQSISRGTYDLTISVPQFLTTMKMKLVFDKLSSIVLWQLISWTDLKKLRDSRCIKAFHSGDNGRKSVDRDIDVCLNCNAIKHLIQTQT